MYKARTDGFLLVAVLLAAFVLACASGSAGKARERDRSGTQDIGDMQDESFFNIDKEVEADQSPWPFEKLDRNGDGRLGWVEFQRGEIKEIQYWEFKEFDNDGDGLDREEYGNIVEYMQREGQPTGKPDKID